jgi:microcystin-dependent protein
MPYNGSGTFTPLITFQPNTPATAEDQNSQDTDISSGISNSITKDGQGIPSANISWNNYRITNLGNPVLGTDACNYMTAQGFGNPTGAVVAYAGGSAPSGYLNCNGQAVSRTTYSVLYSVIGTAYGVGDGSTTFNVPNAQSRCIVGCGTGPGLSPRPLATTGGEENHVLSVAELASHNHTDTGHVHSTNDPGHAHVYSNTSSGGSGAGVGVGWSFAGTGATQTAYTSISINTGVANISYTGSGSGHNTMQPFIVLYYIIKT